MDGLTSSSTPENIQKEIEKREMLCYGGVEVSSLPTEVNRSTENGTVFLHPIQTLIEACIKDKSYSYDQCSVLAMILRYLLFFQSKWWILICC